jgi:hypothetical protein
MLTHKRRSIAPLPAETHRESRRGADGRDRAMKPSADGGLLLGMQRAAGNAAVAALLGTPTVQRDDPSPRPATGPIELIFIIRKPNDKFTEGMTEYVKTTLKGHEYREVANVEEMCTAAAQLKAAGVSLSRVRIVGHGQTSVGGVGMTPKGEKTWRYVRPDEVREYMKKPECKSLKTAMAPGAEVEFWGCYLGAIPEAGKAWADLFGAQVKSTTGEVKVGHEDFVVSGVGQIKHSSKVKGKNVEKLFRKWLLARHKMLSATNEAPRLGTDDERFTYMKDLFDRSGGVIRSRVVEDTRTKKRHRPGEQKELDLWETTKPGE